MHLLHICNYVTQFNYGAASWDTMAVGVSAGRSGEGGRRLPPGKQWAMVLEWHKWRHNVINVNMYCTIVYTCATL